MYSFAFVIPMIAASMIPLATALPTSYPFFNNATTTSRGLDLAASPAPSTDSFSTETAPIAQDFIADVASTVRLIPSNATATVQSSSTVPLKAASEHEHIIMTAPADQALIADFPEIEYVVSAFTKTRTPEVVTRNGVAHTWIPVNTYTYRERTETVPGSTVTIQPGGTGGHIAPVGR